MFKFDNSSGIWNELDTIFINEDDKFYFYEIELSSFSFFAIGEKIIVTEEIFEETIEKITNKYGQFAFWGLVALLVVGIGIISFVIIYIILKRREGNLEKPKEILKWDKKDEGLNLDLNESLEKKNKSNIFESFKFKMYGKTKIKKDSYEKAKDLDNPMHSDEGKRLFDNEFNK